jgi:hypothetical protein
MVQIRLKVLGRDPAMRSGFRDLLARAILFGPDRARPINRSQEVVRQFLDAVRVSEMLERGALDVLE